MICQNLNSIHKNWSVLLVLAAVTTAVYSVSFLNGFVWDDEFIIVKNPAIRQMTSIRDLLLSPDVVKPYYRPMSRATYLLDYWLFGMTPSAFHAANVMIHMLNVILLYLVCSKVASAKGSALIAALLFAIHPINTEPVNFISARNNLLSLLFSLASFLSFLQARGRWGRWLFLSAVLFFLGLLSKETALMAFIVIAFYSFFSAPSRSETDLREKALPLLPYLLCVGAYLLLRSLALGGLMGTSALAEGLVARVGQNYYILPYYVKLFLFPVNLTVFHTVPKANFFTAPWFLLAWVAIVLTTWRVVRWHNQGAIFGLLWSAVNYIPIANIVPIPSWSVAERYLYLPAAGLCLVAGEFFGHIYSRHGSKKLVWTASCVLAIVLAVWTVKRNTEWKDDIRLFKSALREDPASASGHFNLGNAYLDRRDLIAAKLEWIKTLEINPGHSDALTQMGTLSATQGDFQQAEQYYNAALHSDPRNAMAYYNLGKLYEMQGNPRKAIEQYEFSLRYIDVTYAEYTQEIEQRVSRLRKMVAK